MLQCPQCGNREFETGMTISARVRITALDNGDYAEEEIERYNGDFGWLTCTRCGYEAVEEEARQAFEAATLQDCADDIYDFYASHAALAPQEDHPRHESAFSLAGAWNFWRWQQEGQHWRQ